MQFDNQKDKIEHDSKILMFKFLSIVEREMELRDMSKKELAQQLDTSASYVTQLFRGTKTINLIKLVQLHLFNIEFDIQLVNNKRKAKKTIRKIKQANPKSLTTAR